MKSNELPIKNYIIYRNNAERMLAGEMPVASGMTYIELFNIDMGIILEILNGDMMPSIKLNSKRLKNKKSKRRYRLLVEEI